jgi:ADP-heptose:LPS heptosyltransferase
VPRRRAAAVVRFSSLGDVLLAAHVPVFLKREDPARRVLFVTKERHAELLRGHPYLDGVHALRDSLDELFQAMRGEDIGEIVDLHRNWRSSRVRAAFPGASVRLSPKYALRRRLWVYARWLRPKPVPPLLRTYRELAGLDPSAGLTPWLKDALSDTERARGLERVGEARSRGFVLLGAGARWGTKRWPAAHFVRLAERIERERGLGARFALSPGEPPAPEIQKHLATRGEAPLAVPFRELAASASHALAIVSNDSAVLHLGPALGVPAVGIFGGTVPEFGFARQGLRDEAVEVRRWCRPCGVHGRPRCPLGHHACMRDLTPDAAYQALSRSLDTAA